MTEEERRAIHKEHTDDIYRSIGKFMVQFEQIVFRMGLTVKLILSKNGLTNPQIGNIITADMTARPMMDMYKSMLLEQLHPIENDEKIIKAILKNITSIIEERNNIIHSTWFVGYGEIDATDFSVAIGQKTAKSSQVIKTKEFRYKSAEFDALSSKCEAILNLINQLMPVVIMGADISKNFAISKDGIVSIIS